MCNIGCERDAQKQAPCTFAAFWFTPLVYSQLQNVGNMRMYIPTLVRSRRSANSDERDPRSAAAQGMQDTDKPSTGPTKE